MQKRAVYTNIKPSHAHREFEEHSSRLLFKTVSYNRLRVEIRPSSFVRAAAFCLTAHCARRSPPLTVVVMIAVGPGVAAAGPGVRAGSTGALVNSTGSGDHTIDRSKMQADEDLG